MTFCKKLYAVIIFKWKPAFWYVHQHHIKFCTEYFFVFTWLKNVDISMLHRWLLFSIYCYNVQKCWCCEWIIIVVTNGKIYIYSCDVWLQLSYFFLRKIKYVCWHEKKMRDDSNLFFCWWVNNCAQLNGDYDGFKQNS